MVEPRLILRLFSVWGTSRSGSQYTPHILGARGARIICTPFARLWIGGRRRTHAAYIIQHHLTFEPYTPVAMPLSAVKRGLDGVGRGFSALRQTQSAGAILAGLTKRMRSVATRRGRYPKRACVLASSRLPGVGTLPAAGRTRPPFRRWPARSRRFRRWHD